MDEENVAQEASEPEKAGPSAADMLRDFIEKGKEPVVDASEEPIAETPGDAEPEQVKAPPVGASDEMKQFALARGIHPMIVNGSKDDATLQGYLDVLASMAQPPAPQEPKAEANPAEPFIKWDLPEEDFKDDPQLSAFAKQLKQVTDAVTKERELLRGAVGDVLKWKQEKTQAEQQEQHDALYEGFDKYLDQFGEAVGKAGSPVRHEIANTYMALGANPKMPAEEKQRLWKLAVERHKPEVLEAKQKAAEKVKQQSRLVSGGKGAMPVEPPKSLIDQLDFFRRNGSYTN